MSHEIKSSFFVLVILIAISFLVEQYSVQAQEFDNYFMLESPDGCMGLATNNDQLLLLDCDPTDDAVWWRTDPRTEPAYTRFIPYSNDSMCIQAIRQPELLNGTDVLKRGDKMFAKECAAIEVRSAKEAFQAFDPTWESGSLTLLTRPDLCMVYSGAEPIIGQSRILLIPCSELGGQMGRVEGWKMTPVEVEYVIVDSKPGFQRGGCMGRNDDGSDELLLKGCRSDDDTLQWRLDNQNRLRSKVNKNECLQAEDRPEVLQTVDNLIRGSRVYAKPCAEPGSIAEDFQVIDDSWVNATEGLMRLQYRPDLCIVHFGAEPVFGESQIMLIECDTLGGARGEGWEAIDPCATPPTCNVRAFNETDSNNTLAIDVYDSESNFVVLDAALKDSNSNSTTRTESIGLVESDFYYYGNGSNQILDEEEESYL